MGKHSAQGRTPPSTPQPAAEPAAAAPPVADVVPTSTPVKPLPSVVQAQTIIFGAIAALVAAVALIWAGVNGRTAFLVGLGLVLIWCCRLRRALPVRPDRGPGSAARSAARRSTSRVIGMNERLVWIDCEMTGLDLGRDALDRGGRARHRLRAQRAR